MRKVYSLDDGMLNFFINFHNLLLLRYRGNIKLFGRFNGGIEFDFFMCSLTHLISNKNCVPFSLASDKTRQVGFAIWMIKKKVRNNLIKLS